MSAALTVRGARQGDRDAFLVMWADFVATFPSEPGNPAIGELNWSRIAAKEPTLRCILALDEGGRPLGFTLYLAFPFTWSRGDACYLQDIYVRPEARGRGAAQAMIENLRQQGLEHGWFKIFWMTQPDNLVAQRVYEKVARRMDYLRYDLDVCEP